MHVFFYKRKKALKLSMTTRPAVFLGTMQKQFALRLSTMLFNFPVQPRALLLWRSPTQVLTRLDPDGLPSPNKVTCMLPPAKKLYSRSLKICSFLRGKLMHTHVVLNQSFPCPPLFVELLIPAQIWQWIFGNFSKQVKMGLACFR